jgi:tRNA (cmo5U34)-methyltransferase
MTTAASVLAFSAHATEYTALRRRLVPRYDAFYGSAVDALALGSTPAAPPTRILDLGAGTGLLTAWVSEAFGDARFDLLDGSAEMLAEARGRLAGVVDRVFVQDMAGALPEGPYDAVISALAIHHLADLDKQALFGRVCTILAPGGVFVNAEQVAGPTPGLAALYRQRWAADAVSQGASAVELADAQRRREHDRCADVESQLRWLREAGFETADCTYKYWESATLVAVKGGLR